MSIVQLFQQGVFGSPRAALPISATVMETPNVVIAGGGGVLTKTYVTEDWGWVTASGVFTNYGGALYFDLYVNGGLSQRQFMGGNGTYTFYPFYAAAGTTLQMQYASSGGATFSQATFGCAPIQDFTRGGLGLTTRNKGFLPQTITQYPEYGSPRPAPPLVWRVPTFLYGGANVAYTPVLTCLASGLITATLEMVAPFYEPFYLKLDKNGVLTVQDTISGLGIFKQYMNVTQGDTVQFYETNGHTSQTGPRTQLAISTGGFRQ